MPTRPRKKKVNVNLSRGKVQNNIVLEFNPKNRVFVVDLFIWSYKDLTPTFKEILLLGFVKERMKEGKLQKKI